MRFTFTCLTLLATAATIAADKVVTLTLPNGDDDDSGSGVGEVKVRIAGTNGSTTSFVSDCPSSATATITASASTSTNDLGCDVTLVSGPRTYWAEYHGETYERCDVGSKTATCYQTVTTTSGSVTLGVSVDSSQVPVTSVAFTVVGTDASATPSDSASASTKTSSGGAAGTTSASATGGANASNTENAALGLPTGHGYVAAGGAVMALALAIA